MNLKRPSITSEKVRTSEISGVYKLSKNNDNDNNNNNNNNSSHTTRKQQYHTRRLHTYPLGRSRCHYYCCYLNFIELIYNVRYNKRSSCVKCGLTCFVNLFELSFKTTAIAMTIFVRSKLNPQVAASGRNVAWK